jgi:hypothetical protein
MSIAMAIALPLYDLLLADWIVAVSTTTKIFYHFVAPWTAFGSPLKITLEHVT